MDTGIDEGLDIVLRPPVASDTARFLELLADPDHRHFASPAHIVFPRTESEVAEKFAEAAEAWAEHRPGMLMVATADQQSTLLGDISWRWSASEQLGVADLGYVVHPDARGRGVGRTAIALMTRWLMSPAGRGLARVQLDHSTENAASCRVAVAAGFEREGIRRGYLPLLGPDGVVRRHDVCLHGTLEPPPLPSRQRS